MPSFTGVGIPFFFPRAMIFPWRIVENKNDF